MAAKGTQRRKSTQRKLTAILCADVVGYSRLMGADEEATIETLTAYRKVFTSDIKKHRGRVVDAKGDAIMAEFASVVDAVNGAVEIQRKLAEQNANLPDDRRMDFRIGINLGDVVVKDDAIYGDGVNIAARLESLAEPGGICISRPVYDQVESKLNLECEYLGEQQVKNIAKPVRAYQVRIDPPETQADKDSVPEPASLREETSIKGACPSLAVLPFANMSNDPEQEYFSDGISEDLITALSNISRLSVVSRNTAFTYKGRALNVRQVGKELDVRYLLEGSVRKAGNRVRITAQLIDAVTDRHLWSERYDRELEDIFAVQDEICSNIVTALDVRLLDGEQARIWRKSTRSGEAYDLLLRARNTLQTTGNRDGHAQAYRLWESAIEKDPNFARAYAALAQLKSGMVRAGWSQSPEEDIERAFELANKAIELDGSLDYGYSSLSNCFLVTKQFKQALAEAERAVALNPEGGDVLIALARAQIYMGKPGLAVDNVRKAKRLAPGYPSWYSMHLGVAYLALGEYELALAALKESLETAPDSTGTHMYLAATYVVLKQNEKAEAEAREVMRIEPQFALEKWAVLQPFKEPKDLQRIVQLLRKAGLPD